MSKAKTETLGQRLKRLRLAKDWTQTTLARAAGCFCDRSNAALQKAVSQLENDEIAKPDVYVMAAFAEALGVTIEELI